MDWGFKVGVEDESLFGCWDEELGVELDLDFEGDEEVDGVEEEEEEEEVKVEEDLEEGNSFSLWSFKWDLE